MTPQERQLVDDLFARLSKVEGASRDPDAVAAITQGLRTAPNAIYALVQTVLVQDEALKQAHHRIEELEAADAPQQNQGGGSFLDSMRGAIFGESQPHGSVPNVPPPAGSRPVWNSGQVLQQSQSPGHYDQGYGQNQGYGHNSYGQGSYNQGYGAPQGGAMGSPMGGAFGGGGGGSFLGTAAAAAAGVVGGSLLLNSFRGMMGGTGGGRSAFGDTSTTTENRSPWSDQSRSDLARDAGINDVGSQDRSRQDLAQQDREQDAEQDRDDDNQRAGLFDSASNDDDHDSDRFDNDGDSDSA
jgi:uncharacterized protein